MQTLIKILCLSSFLFAEDLIVLNNGSTFSGTIKDKSEVYDLETQWISMKDTDGINRNIKKSNIWYIKFENGDIYDSLGDEKSLNDKDSFFGSNKITHENYDKYSHLNTNNQILHSAGESLKSFRRKSYIGLMLNLAGSALIISNPKDTTAGSILSLIGTALSLLAINDIGEAGEKLEKVDIKE